MTMFRLLDVVRLKKDNLHYGVPTTVSGTIVDVHEGGKAYTVEFIDNEGNTFEDALFDEFTDADLEAVELIV